MNEPGTCKRIFIEGGNINDISSFYAEINRVFMVGETWALGESLDALNDMLHGGYGVIANSAHVIVTWKNMDASRGALGPDTTLRFLRARLQERENFNNRSIASQIAALERGEGDTYFDIVMDVFSDHPNIRIEAA